MLLIRKSVTGPPTPPPSYICHFSQRSDTRDTKGSKDGSWGCPTGRAQSLCPKSLQKPTDDSPGITLCRLGNCTDLWCFSGYKIIFISIRFQTYTKVFRSKCTILSILIPCINLGVSDAQCTLWNCNKKPHLLFLKCQNWALMGSIIFSKLTTNTLKFLFHKVW